MATQQVDTTDKANGKGGPQLQEQDKPTHKNLAGKLAAIMGEINRVAKRGRNDFHKYDYVTEADLSDAIRPLLAKYNVALTASVESFENIILPQDGGKTPPPIAMVWMNFELQCAESGEKTTSRFPGMGQDKADKGVYKAITGATKYWMFKTFLVSTGDDPEVESEFDRQQGAQPQRGKSDFLKGKPQGSQAPSDQHQYDQQAQLMADYGQYEQDAIAMREMKSVGELDQFMRNREQAITANAYSAYYYNLAQDLRETMLSKVN